MRSTLTNGPNCCDHLSSLLAQYALRFKAFNDQNKLMQHNLHVNLQHSQHKVTLSTSFNIIAAMIISPNR
jgi:hypothetical protein